MDKSQMKMGTRDGSAGFFYFTGFLGSVVYYFQHADTFGQYLVGFLKALVWPAFLVHRAMEALGM